MSNLTELKDAIVKTMEANGIVGVIKASIRSSVYKAVELEGKFDADTPKTRLSKFDHGAAWIEMVAEFLEFFGFKHTLSVFLAEAGMQLPLKERSTLLRELGMEVDDRTRGGPVVACFVPPRQRDRLSPHPEDIPKSKQIEIIPRPEEEDIPPSSRDHSHQDPHSPSNRSRQSPDPEPPREVESDQWSPSVASDRSRSQPAESDGLRSLGGRSGQEAEGTSKRDVEGDDILMSSSSDEESLPLTNRAEVRRTAEANAHVPYGRTAEGRPNADLSTSRSARSRSPSSQSEESHRGAETARTMWHNEKAADLLEHAAGRSSPEDGSESNKSVDSTALEMECDYFEDVNSDPS